MHLSTLFIIGVLAIIVFAGSVEAIEFKNPLEHEDIVSLIHGIGEWIRNIGLVLATVVILWAAFMYLTSGGSEEKIAAAKKALLWAVVGIAILLIGSGIAGIIKGILTVK